ncbi:MULTISPECIES: thioredoxin [Pseudobutyrivibrio]|uniref:Thioredoxin n=2 Tax=Pseudobutyrivibrio xylanivorans TaxID=185007 RepID=A0A1M6AS56_PSEXY|nr:MULTISPECIES: thioredoxin [Pseudobutyrivibrio]MDC7278598.1 thioredoxin [Butyrivibrio fibrisolvens]SCZ77879.1 thioredoxin [Pseudobutyrivibrio xylanivorans]SHI39300.1 thioredoxin [Pseudobutyrivibrio xylanivorans DSM 14809]
MVKKITTDEFNSMDKAGVSVLDFNAVWCGPCKMLGPVLEEVSEEMADDAKFYSIDTDENPDLAKEFGIMNIPAVVILKDGQKVDMNVGFVPKDALKDFVTKNL